MIDDADGHFRERPFERRAVGMEGVGHRRGNGPRSMGGGPTLLSSSHVGSANRRRVLQALFDNGPMSRADLARQAGVNRTTITGIVQPLIEHHLLVEGDPVPSTGAGGKPARPLWFSPDAQPICGVLLMAGSVRSALVTLDGEILSGEEEAFPADTQDLDTITGAVCASIERTLGAAKRPPSGIGVAVGGMVDTDHMSIVAMNLAPVLNGFLLGHHLEQRFSLPVVIDHHPRALLVGDRWFGKGRGVRDFAVIYTGEVLGGALFLDGQLQRGAGGAGGELGHTFVQVDGRLCRCGRRGCWDTIATLGWLRGEAAVAWLPMADRMDSQCLAGLVEAGAHGAADLQDRYARNVAFGIANLQQTVAPNFFILHGDVVGGGERMIDAILAHVRDLVPQRPGAEITFACGEAEDRAALLGAAGLVLSHLLQIQL